MKKIAIQQSNYIPWKGYFDIINSVDEFIFHDDLQYTKGDWRNRNKIKTNSGLKWLTIPCGSSENRLICDVELIDSSWQKKHWNLISSNYLKAPYFHEYKEFFQEFFLNNKWNNLSVLNQTLIKKISNDILGIQTKFKDSRAFNLQYSKGERVLELLIKANASEYLSGPAAKNYIDQSKFESEGIKLKWMDYSGYKIYNQLYPPFEHGVSILDLIFNEGPNYEDYMKSFN